MHEGAEFQLKPLVLRPGSLKARPTALASPVRCRLHILIIWDSVQGEIGNMYELRHEVE